MRDLCFLDMDGVLVNFIDAAHKLHNQRTLLPDWPYEKGEKSFDVTERLGISVSDFFAPMGFSFWKNLEWFDFGDSPLFNGKLLLESCESLYGVENICILTSPCLTPGCVEGKRAWIDKHMPKYKKQVLFGSAKHYCAHKNAILYDDKESNVSKFKGWGGKASLMPRPWNSNFKVWDEKLCPTK
jgi:hypothetical protein